MICTLFTSDYNNFCNLSGKVVTQVTYFEFIKGKPSKETGKIWNDTKAGRRSVDVWSCKKGFLLHLETRHFRKKRYREPS